MLEKKRFCDLCGCEGPFESLVREVPSVDSVLVAVGVEELLHTVVCRQCGWVFKPEILSQSQLNTLYGLLGGTESYRSDAVEQNILRSAELHFWLDSNIGLSGNRMTVLDVGGGVGQVSNALSEHGHEVTILDLVINKPLYEDMKCIKGTLQSMQDRVGYDLILMNHVLEHVWTPSEMLKQAEERLNMGGYIYVEVPFELYTPIVRRRLGDPCHVGYFTLNTLKMFLTKAGFHVVKVERFLGRYNDRRVMVLRGLARKAENEDMSLSWGKNAGQFSLLKELLGARQLYIMAQYLAGRVFRKLKLDRNR